MHVLIGRYSQRSSYVGPQCAAPCYADDGMATEDDEDETVLPPPEMAAEPASTAEAAQNAAQAVAHVRNAELKERTRLEEDAIGISLDAQQCSASQANATP